MAAQTMISIRVNQDLHEAVSAKAKKANVSVSEFVKSLIEDSVNAPKAVDNNLGSGLSAKPVNNLAVPVTDSNINSFALLAEDFKTMVNDLLITNQQTFAWLAEDLKHKIDNTVFNTIISAVTEANLQIIAIQRLTDIECNILDWMNLLLSNSVYMSTYSATNLFDSMSLCFRLEHNKPIGYEEHKTNVAECKQQATLLATLALGKVLTTLFDYPDNPTITERMDLLKQNIDIMLQHILRNIAEAKTYSAQSLFALEGLKYYLENNRHLTDDEYQLMIATHKNAAQLEASKCLEQYLKIDE